jgi:outer membrane protein
MNIQTFIISFLITLVIPVWAQEKPEKWDLAACINYALANNIQIQKSKISLEQSDINLKLAKAQLHPDLNASVGQNFTNRPFLISEGEANSYRGNYGISSSMTLFDGGILLKNIKQQKLLSEVSSYAILAAEKSIEMAILQNYIQILYATDAITVYKETIKASQYQRDRGEALLQAGSISKVELAQLQAQLSSNEFLLVSAENTLALACLRLKQLLELKLEDNIDIVIPEIDDGEILKPLADLANIYRISLEVMPQMKSSRLNVDINKIETEIAKGGYYPRISLNASAGTSHVSDGYLSFEDQLRDNFNDGVGVTVNIPIFTNRRNKSAVESARLNEKNAQLDLQEAEKNLLTELETVYQDALSAQSQYVSATENVKALQVSYDLFEQQFSLGMKNTLDMLTAKNELLAATQNQLQAKYMSIMNAQLLNLYQDLPISLMKNEE